MAEPRLPGRLPWIFRTHTRISPAFTGATAASCARSFWPAKFFDMFHDRPRGGRTSLESVLLRDKWILAVALVVTTGLCWAWIVPMARDMYGDMDGSSAWMM